MNTKVVVKQYLIDDYSLKRKNIKNVTKFFFLEIMIFQNFLL